MSRKWFIAGLALAFQLAPTAAAAAPYVLVARYQPYDANGKPVEIPLSNEADASAPILPYDTASHSLEGIYIRLKTDDISKVSLSNTRNLVFISGKDVTNIKIADAPKEVRLENVPRTSKTARYDIAVRSKPTPGYLCAQETQLRKNWKAAKANEIVGIPTLAPADLLSSAADSAMQAYGVLRTSVPAENESPILFTFCTDKGEELFDWDAMAKPREAPKPTVPTQPVAGTRTTATTESTPKPSSSFHAPTTTEGKALLAQHKHALSTKLAGFMERTSNVSIHVGSDQPGLPENVYFEDKHAFSVVDSIGKAFKLKETDGVSTERVDERMIIDQKSLLHVIADGKVCHSGAFSCADLMTRYIHVSLDAKDKNGNPIKKEIELDKQGYRARLKIAMSEFVHQEVTLSVRYRNGDVDFKLYDAPVSIENLGVITSFPVASEIIALASRTKPGQANTGDLKLQSSIPVSYAFDLSANSSGKHAAITLPWMLGYNFRRAPRFADMVKVFPHASVILPLSEDTTEKEVTADMALGAGVSLANAFQFSWGVTVTSETPKHYLLVGISVPDLIKAMDW